MNKDLLFELFEPTNHYVSRESLNELRDCYEHYSLEYISAADFLKELNNLGFKNNKNNQVKLKMKKDIRKSYFGLG